MASAEKFTKNAIKKPARSEEEPEERRDEEDRSVDEASRESFPASDSPAWSVPVKRKKQK